MLKAVPYLALLAALVLSGCSTVQDAHSLKGKGTSKVYEKPYEPVWLATRDAVMGSGLRVVSEDKTKGEILAQGSVTAFSWGENVAVFVESLNAQSSKVEVISKKVLATNVTAKNWTPTLFQALDNNLANEKPAAAATNSYSTLAAQTPTCEGEKECLAKWEAAQLWIVHNAGYKIQNMSSVLLETYNSTGNSTKLAVQVTKEPLGNGKYRILAKIGCGYQLCVPNASDALLDFNQKVNAATP